MDNLNVVRHIGRILACRVLDKPYELLVDGNLLTLVCDLVSMRSFGTGAISKVKVHADDENCSAWQGPCG